MKLLSIIVSLYLSANAVIGAPLIKAIISTLGVEQPIATGVYGIASVGASFAVEHTGLFGPLLNNLPGAQVILNAANLLGGRFAGATAGGIASKATLGANPIYKEIAHSLGYDYVQASNAGAAVSDSIRGLVNAVGSLDQFKPIIHPDVVGTINAVENYGGLISSLVGFVIKLVVRYLYSSDLLNDTPYIGELIRNADHMIEPQYTSAL
ncbi:hypothetical protein FB639_003041, partial [Coemansia asiatica]